MKRISATALLLLCLSWASYAQNDDIYGNGRDQRAQNQNTAPNPPAVDNRDANMQQPMDNGQADASQNYNNPDEYVDYDDDSYGTRINRFDNSFYNMGYYSTFYNPYWYNPYWYDPYWGYNPWYPGISVSFGFGPCWYSGWGWNMWLGYPGFGSCWGYQFYAGGWYGHFYGGFWNRYYGGFEGRRFGYGRYVAAGYGPRQTSIGSSIGYRTAANGLRTAGPTNSMGLRTTALAAAPRTGSNGMRTSGMGAGNRASGGGNFQQPMRNNASQGQRFGGNAGRTQQ